MSKRRTEIQNAKNRKKLEAFKRINGIGGNSKYRMKKTRFGKNGRENPKSPFYGGK